VKEKMAQAVDQGMIQAKKEFEDLAKSNPSSLLQWVILKCACSIAET